MSKTGVLRLLERGLNGRHTGTRSVSNYDVFPVPTPIVTSTPIDIEGQEKDRWLGQTHLVLGHPKRLGVKGVDTLSLVRYTERLRTLLVLPPFTCHGSGPGQ